MKLLLHATFLRASFCSLDIAQKGLGIVMPRQRFSGSVNAQSVGARSVKGAATFPDSQPIDDLFSATYEELRRMARFVKRDYGHATLSPTTLVNEAWLKLAGSRALEFASVLHFKLTAARAMRQILVEAARRQAADKRGGGNVMFVVFDESSMQVRCDRQILALHDCLNKLAELNPRQALLVEGRYFGGLDVAEIAALLDISEATALRDWRAARAWLGAEMRGRC
jgi:RNA polymerase sigma factor (TIGR02999 family)